jgi:hypothetical protein
MATPKKIVNQGAIDAARRAEAERPAKLAEQQAKLPVVKEALATAQVGARGTTGQTIFEKALAGIPAGGDAGAARGLAAMSARYGLQAAAANAYTGENIGYNISEQTKAEQGDVTNTENLINVYSTPVNIPGAIYEEEKKEETTGNLSLDAFINTLKLLMGSAEASKPYVKELYNLVSKYYKSGSTIPDAINLALYDAEENKLIPEFTTRFSGIFKLRDRRSAGEIIDVPTIAEYIKSQEGIAEVLRNTGLKDLANETFLNQVMGTGKSVFETTKIITDVYDAIRLAPAEWRAMVNTKMPFATDTDLAKALLLGAEGAADLERKVNKYGIMAAAQGQGLTIGETTAGELLAKGQGYASSKPKFGQAAAIIPTAQKLTSMETGVEPRKAYTQEQAFSAVFDQNYQALQDIQNLSEREIGRFSAKSGRFASKDRGLGQI